MRWRGAEIPDFRSTAERGPRRLFLAGTGAVVVGALLDAFLLEPNWLDVTRHEVPVARLPRHLDGYTVAHITDAHLSGLGRVETAILDTLRSENVQLVVLSGDIVDSQSSLGLLREFGAPLKRPGTDVVASLGNWEHWADISVSELRRAYADIGAKLQVNEGETFAGGVSVFATDDATAGSPTLAALEQTEARAHVQILVSHSPAFLDRAALRGHVFDLALAGHTHGGQLRLGPRGIPFRPAGSGRFTAGWYQTEAGRAYVSRGTGTSIVPARFTCRPELALFRLCQG